MSLARFDNNRIVLDFVNQSVRVINAAAVACAVFETFGLTFAAQNSVALNAPQQTIDFVERFWGLFAPIFVSNA